MLRVAIAFVGLFLLGTVIGGVIAMVSKPLSGGPVAVATPIPSAVPTTTAPIASATAVVPTLPTATTTVTALPTLPPQPTPSSEPTPAQTVAPTAAPTADPAAIDPFIEELGAAIAAGRDRFLFDNLHPAVIERYGEQACRDYTSTTRSQGLSIEYVSANGPEAWDWVLDDRTTQIPDAWTVSVIWREPGLEEAREVHIAPSEASWRWFTDCGDPLN